MLKSYKYRLYPNKIQAELLNKHFGAARFIYNLALETKNHAYSAHLKNISCSELHKQLTDLRNNCDWLKEISQQSLESSITNLDKAYTNFFKGHGDFPKFKSKRNGVQSFQARRFSSIKDNKLFLAKFREGINIVLHRKFEGKIRTVTISKTSSNKYFASILINDNKPAANKKPVNKNTSIGIDLGLKHFIVTSDGVKIDNPIIGG